MNNSVPSLLSRGTRTVLGRATRLPAWYEICMAVQICPENTFLFLVGQDSMYALIRRRTTERHRRVP
jgi:hypothetical protein